MSIMVWCGLTINGATRVHFVEPGDKIDQIYYRNRIMRHAKREGNRLFGHRDWVYQQDGAPSHTANKTQAWCATNLELYLPKQHWPPQSPDLNPLDYFWWNEVVQEMSREKYLTLNEFKAEITRASAAVPLWKIRNAINAFPTRVRRVEDAKGKHCHNI